MNVNSLFRAGDYLALAPNQNAIKDKAKIWVEVMIKPEILESAHDNDRLYSLYVVLFAIAYIPDDPSNIEGLRIELQNLYSRIRDLNSIYGDRKAYELVFITTELMGLVKQANEKLGLIQYADDREFGLCKELLRNFSRLLQEVISKLTTSSPKSYKNQYTENENDILIDQYMQFKSDFNIETEIIPNHILQAQVPYSPISSESRGIDTKNPLTPQSVLRILVDGLKWNGAISILHNVTTYGKSSNEVDKNSILEKFHNWSSNLISIADSNLFRYLSSNISEPSKAYIIHETFLCVSDDKLTFSKLMSYSIRICLFQPIEATDYDLTLKYVLDRNMINIIKNIVNSDLDGRYFRSLIHKIFYAPLDSDTDGETIIGGYIFLNSKYMNMTYIYQASAKISLVHELGHLLLRLKDNKYNFLKHTPEKSVKIQAPVSDVPSEKKTAEIGDFVETELFGFAVYYINDSAIKFINQSTV